MDNLEKIFGALRAITLSSRERHNMRLHLQAYAHEHPLGVTLAARIAERFRRMPTAVGNALNSQSFFTHPIFAALVLVLGIGLSTSYAAERALPGQALYSFKTRVNEPIQGALALTPAAKAQWSAELTTRRLQEAEELAATDQLTPVATADITDGLDYAVQNFNANVALVSKSDDVEAANAQLDLEAALNAHEVVLSSLPTKQKNNVTEISSHVQKHVAAISEERSNAIATLTATDSPEVKTAALVQMKTAHAAIAKTKLLTTVAIDTQVASSVTAIAQEADTDISVGDSDAKHGHWGKAYGAFQDAIRKMKETQDGIETRKWLKRSFGIGLDAAATSATSTATSTTQDASSSDSGDSTSTQQLDD